jgi:hypothetical protein
MMSKHSMTTTLISVVLAVGLFLVASYFEDDARWQLPESDGSEIALKSRTFYESPLQTISSSENCELAERDLVRSVDDARACQVDEDCTIFDFGYPIQCLTSVAKLQITLLRLEYRRYQASCDFRVYYDCPSGHLDRQPVCRENRCAVELRGADDLKEQTLDYLKIE